MTQWNGFELSYPDGRTTNTIYVPENIPHFYAGGVAKVVSVGFDSQGKLPDVSGLPEENRAADMVIAGGNVNWPDPHAAFRNDGTVEVAGYIPAGKGETPVFLQAQPSKVLTDAEKAAKAFHDALADPSSLVSPAPELVSDVQAAAKAALTMPPPPGAWAKLLAAVKAALA